MKTIKYHLSLKSLFVLTSMVMITSSCRKLIEIDPQIQFVNKKNVYDNTANASAVLIGLYHDMALGSFDMSFATGENSFSVNLGLYADELISSDPFNAYMINNLSEDKDYYWSELYRGVFRTNSAIEGISGSTSLIPEVKRRLLGEAKFLRAFYNFYLVNLFGDVPLLTTTDYATNRLASRTPTADVFDQIIRDLKDAQEMLDDNYVAGDILTSSTERARPNKSAATAMLARVYLYNRQWQLAENEATKIISNSIDYALTSLDSVFLKNSKEAIWQLQPVNRDFNTPDAAYFIPSVDASQINTYLNDHLLAKFDSADGRRMKWMQPFNASNFYYPYKYKINTNNGQFEEYLMVLRVGEQYLIRAEARAQLENIAGALDDIFTIRSRAGLTDPISANAKNEALDLIADERQRELFSEWGHRWFDIKRNGKADELLSVIKTGNWETWKQLFPIPANEILKNPSLTGHQNPGY